MTTSTPLATPTKLSRALTSTSSSFSHTGSYRMERKRPSNTEFDEQIKQLEMEGSQLLVAASSLSDSLAATRSKKCSPSKNGSGRSFLASNSLAQLADISEDQKTIAELCAQLDAKSKETETITRQLVQRRDENYPIPQTSFWGSSAGSLLDKLDIHYLTAPLITQHLSHPIMSTTSNRAHDIQDENIDLRTKLSDALTIADKQKEHFRNTVDGLRRQLESAAVTKDALIRTKEMENARQQEMVIRLQQNIDQLERVNRTKEQILIEVNEKLDVQHRENRLIDVALDQLRGRIRDQEHKRGKPFNESTSVTQQDVTSLVRCIDRCIQELDSDVSVKTKDLQELSLNAAKEKETFAENERKLEQDYQSRLSDLSKKHLEERKTERELHLMVKKQLNLLEEQKEQLEHQIQVKSTSMSDLVDRVADLQEESSRDQLLWHQKKDALENALSETQRALAQTMVDQNLKIQEIAVLESRFADVQKSNCDMMTQLEAVSMELKHARDWEEQLVQNQNVLEEEAKQKGFLIKDLEQKIEVIRVENETQLKEMVLALEKEGDQNSARRIQSMSIQISALTEKCHKLNLDLELTRSHHQNLQEKQVELKSSYKTVCDQLQLTSAGKDQLNALLTEKLSEIRMLTLESAERMKSADAAIAEVMSLKSLKDKLLVQLEEREKNFVSLKDQNEKLTAVLESHGQMSYVSRKERDDFERKVLEIEGELKIIQMGKDAAEAKLKHMEGVEKEMKNISEELSQKKSQLEKVVEAKENLRKELKDSKYEISSLKEQVEMLRRSLEQKEGNMGKDFSRVSQRLKAAEHQLRLSHRALKTHQEVDGKAVTVASRMQREVTEKRNEIDSLCTKIHLLEESLEASKKKKVPTATLR